MKFSQNLDWFWHCVEAVVIALVVTAFLWVPFRESAITCAVFGLGFGAGHFHGREKRDCEVKFNIPSPHLVSYWFGKWNRDQLTDFLAPLTVCLLLLWVIL